MRGAQANLWTEYISDELTVEYMLLPRLCALAETLWSPKASRDWQVGLSCSSCPWLWQPLILAAAAAFFLLACALMHGSGQKTRLCLSCCPVAEI